MKIALVSHSDLKGGAAVVTYRLAETLRSMGHDARMLVFSKESDTPWVYQAGNPLRRSYAKLAERIQIFTHNGFSKKNLFKVSTASVGIGLSENSFIREADAVILGWVNQGLLSLEDVRCLGQMGKPLLWVMHDMWEITGICHHSLGCLNFETGCGDCRFLGGCAGDGDLSEHTFIRKKEIYGSTDITFVAVSRWLAGLAGLSPLVSGKRVEVIPNPFPCDDFRPDNSNAAMLSGYGIDIRKKLIVMGAARLDDPIKDLPTAIEALNIIADINPAVSGEWEAVFFGGIRDRSVFGRLRFPHVYVGKVTSRTDLANLYASSAIVLSSSSFETLPGTLIEGQSAGAVPVTFGNGGQRDIISHLETGYISDMHSAEGLARGIEWAMSADIPRERLHASVAANFGAEKVAERFLELIRRSANFSGGL